MNESSWPLGDTADRQFLILILVQYAQLQNFPEFEVGPTEDWGLGNCVIVAHIVLLFVVANNRATILYLSRGQTLPFSVDLDELAVVEVLLDVGRP